MDGEELKTNDTTIEGKEMVEQRELARTASVGVGTHIITAESVQAEEVPTIPLDSLHTLSRLQPEVAIHSVEATHTVSTPTPLVVQPSEYRRGLGEWIQIWRDGLRLYYLPLSLLPILLGTVLAWVQTISQQTPFGNFQLLPFVGAIAVAIFIQSGAHLINDYYDYLRGIDTSNTLGPGRMIQEGYVRPTSILSAGFVLVALGTILGVFVAFRSGIQLVLAGFLAVLCAYFYSATKLSLSSKGLGELVAFLIFGPFLTLGAYALQVGELTFSSGIFLFSLPSGFLATAVIHANNMRDIEGDEQAGKRTLANLMGITLSRLAFIALLLAAYAIIVPQGIPSQSPHWFLITLWTFPTLVMAISGAFRINAPAGFHQLMRQTLNLATAFTLLLILALIITAVIPVLPEIQFNILQI